MAKKPVKKAPPAKKVFEPKYMVLMNSEGERIGKYEFTTESDLIKFYDENNMTSDDVNFVTKDEFELVVIDSVTIDDKSTEIILDETPEPKFDESNLPTQLNVENKKSGKLFKVSRKYFLANRGELNLV